MGDPIEADLNTIVWAGYRTPIYLRVPLTL